MEINNIQKIKFVTKPGSSTQNICGVEKFFLNRQKRYENFNTFETYGNKIFVVRAKET